MMAKWINEYLAGSRRDVEMTERHMAWELLKSIAARPVDARDSMAVSSDMLLEEAWMLAEKFMRDCDA